MNKRQKGKKSMNGEKNSIQAKKTLGPVENLEAHVRSDWWRGMFNTLYLKTDGDVVMDEEITEREVSLIADVIQPQAGARILDLCCGQGRHALAFARRGFDAEGFDRSHYLIQRARATARKEGLNIRFREGDAKKLPYRPDSFDAVTLLGNSFGYFETVQEDLRILTEVRKVLKPWGKVVLDIADGDYLREHFSPRSWEWIDNNLFVCRERALSQDGERLISREVVTDVQKGVIADQFYAERLYSHDSIIKLLKSAGFSDFQFQNIETSSQRNQDLGMMERRFVVSAVIKKEWTPVKVKVKSSVVRVAVLMGDPQKPDPVKPDCTFNEDDFATIEQMKDALTKLNGYTFSYYSSHDLLLQDLLKMRGKIDYVFNLCDEGFENDARKELHVPALLEVLGLPYTGAGPQSLAKCYDKSLVRGSAREMGIPVPEALFVGPGDRVYELPFGFPVIVKPNCGDSSIGINQNSVAYSIEDLDDAITQLRTRLGSDTPFLVEEFLTGSDITVGIIGNTPDSSTVFPITEEDYSSLPPGLPPICGYEAKWLPESPYWNLKSKPADLPPETEKMVVRWCLMLFERFECRDYCRFDWRLDSQGRPKLLEVNPNPGWCWDGHLAKMAQLVDISYPEMLGMILKTAETRMGISQEGLIAQDLPESVTAADSI
jgi:D-alanine-D-alanine ligase